MFQLLNRANVNNDAGLLYIRSVYCVEGKTSSEFSDYSIRTINGKPGANITTMLPLL
jgi:hypothetical protein